MVNFSDCWTEIDQIGVLSDDIEKTIETMRQIFGLEPTKRIDVAPGSGDSYYRGKPRYAGTTIVFYRIGNIDLEIICPTAGESLHHEYLKKHGTGLYHIRYNVENYDAVLESMARRGFEPAMEGISSTGSGAKWAYFDTEPQLGYYIEIGNGKTLNKKD